MVASIIGYVDDILRCSIINYLIRYPALFTFAHPALCKKSNCMQALPTFYVTRLPSMGDVPCIPRRRHSSLFRLHLDLDAPSRLMLVPATAVPDIQLRSFLRGRGLEAASPRGVRRRRVDRNTRCRSFRPSYHPRAGLGLACCCDVFGRRKSLPRLLSPHLLRPGPGEHHYPPARSPITLTPHYPLLSLVLVPSLVLGPAPSALGADDDDVDIDVLLLALDLLLVFLLLAEGRRVDAPSAPHLQFRP